MFGRRKQRGTWVPEPKGPARIEIVEIPLYTRVFEEPFDYEALGADALEVAKRRVRDRFEELEILPSWWHRAPHWKHKRSVPA